GDREIFNEEVRPFPLEEPVIGDANHQLEVAPWCPRFTGVPLAADEQPQAGVGPRRHRHADRPLDLGAPGAATPGTRVCNHCAGPLALGARLPQLEESLPLDEFATTAAPGTGCPLVALASASGAFQTHFVPP